MGLILGALAGAGGQMADYADKQITQDQALERQTNESNLATQRAQALAEFQHTMANRQRGEMVQRVQDAAGNIADQQMAPVVQQEQAGITDPSSWTPEQQAAVDQSNSMQRQGIVKQALQDGSAGIATGDITPEKAAELTQRGELAVARMDTMQRVADARWEAYNARTDAQYEAAIAKIEAAVAKGGGNTDFDKKIKMLKEAGISSHEIANFIIERKQPSLEELATTFLKNDPQAGNKDKAMTPQQAVEKAKALRELTHSLDNPPAPPAPAPAPAAAAPGQPLAIPGLPPGFSVRAK